MEGIAILVWLIGIAVEVLSIVFSERTEPCRHKKGYMIACAILSGLYLLMGLVAGLTGKMPDVTMAVTGVAIIIWAWYWCGYAIQRLAYRKGYTISLGWGFWFGIFALLYWGFMPTEPSLQILRRRTKAKCGFLLQMRYYSEVEKGILHANMQSLRHGFG